MYKSRGKPDDPWNILAAEQEKGLAEAIQVSPIQLNGPEQKIQSVSTSALTKHNQIAKKLETYEEFKATQSETFKKPALVRRQLKSLTLKPDANSKTRQFKGFAISDVPKATAKKSKHAMVQAPLGAIKTKGVDVPVTHNEDTTSIWYHPRFGEGESSFFNLNRNSSLSSIGNMNDTYNETNIFKELQEVDLEYNIGNAQLEKLSKILQATKRLPSIKEEEPRYLYNVKPRPIQQKTPTKKAAPPPIVSKKSKLMLTLNDINERLLKMQAKFFTKSRPPYRTIDGINYMKKSKPLEKTKKDTETSQIFLAETKASLSPATSPRSAHAETASPKSQSSEKVGKLNLDFLNEADMSTHQNLTLEKLTGSSSHTASRFSSPRKSKESAASTPKNQINSNKKLEPSEPVFKPELSAAILKSDFLKKEFELQCEREERAKKGLPDLETILADEASIRIYSSLPKVREQLIALKTKNKLKLDGSLIHKDSLYWT